MPSLVDHLIQFYSDSPISFGAADICSASAPESLERAGAFGVVMSLARTEEGRSLVKRVVVIMPPPGAIRTIEATSIRASVVRTAERWFGRPLREEELDSIEAHVIPTHAASFMIPAALEALETASKHDAVIVLYAAHYRSADRASEPAQPREPVFHEDHWIAPLLHLTQLVVDYAKSRNCYVLLDTGEEPPHKQENTDSLMIVPDCGVFTISTDRNDLDHLAANWGDWLRQIREGRVASVFAKIDELPQSLHSQKGFIKLQLVEDVVPAQELLKMLNVEIAMHQQIDPSARVKLALLAMKAQDEDLAAELLRPATPDLASQEDLETALAVGDQASDQGLIDEAVTRLKLLFPESSKLVAHTLKNLMDDRRYSDVISFLDRPHPKLGADLEFFHRTLATALRAENPEYERVTHVIAKTVPTLQAMGRALASREALARRDFETSVALCLPECGELLTSGTARMLLRATRQALLQRYEGELILTGDQLVVPVIALLRYLSANPLDGTTRIGITNLLSAEITGSLGLAVAVGAVTTLASSTVAPVEYSGPRETTDNSEFDLSSFMRKALEWMAAESPFIPGITKFPESLLPAPADDVFEAVRMLLRHHGDLRNFDDQKTFEYIVYTGVLIAPLTSTPNDDLDLIRYAGAKLIAAHRAQRGRDLAEQALFVARDFPERRRLAWMAFSDIYHRAQSPIESLIGLACMFAAEARVDVGQLAEEASLLIRVLRDLHFIDGAKSMLGLLKSFADISPIPARYSRRIATLELSIEVKTLGENSCTQSRLRDVTSRIESHCAELLDVEEELSPALSLLVQCIRLALFRGFAPPQSAISTFESLLPKVSPVVADLMETLANSNSEGRRLLTLAKSIEAARNHEDIAFDLTMAAVVASRLLDSNIDALSDEEVILAIETLTDHAIKGSAIGSAGSPFASLETSYRRVAEISALGCRVVCLGLSEKGALVRVSALDGRVEKPIVEPREVFSVHALRKWSECFPYDYAYTDDPNAMWTSTDELALTLSGALPTVLVMDVTLQELPPNLIRIGQDFAGRLMPIGSAPSIAWLSAAQSIPFAPRGNRRAWMPLGRDDETGLARLSARLKDSLDGYDFIVNNGAELPSYPSGSELSVVAAHGGLLPENRYIQRLSAEAELAIYPSALASALSGSSVVILFICSAGRVDSHPHANTTVGLIKELLNEGCLTVVAPPWPLNVKVPPIWLPRFMERWSEGATIMDAVFSANAAVAQSFDGNPVDFLAMNVFGNPLLRREPE